MAQTFNWQSKNARPAPGSRADVAHMDGARARKAEKLANAAEGWVDMVPFFLTAEQGNLWVQLSRGARLRSLSMALVRANIDTWEHLRQLAGVHPPTDGGLGVSDPTRLAVCRILSERAGLADKLAATVAAYRPA